MPINFSLLRKLLHQQTDRIIHRHIVVFAGGLEWQKKNLNKLLDDNKEDFLWVGEDAPEFIPAIPVNKAHSWLGREKRVVVFDATIQFNADAFAAISGIVTGGGFFILLMPAIELWDSIYSSHFGQRLVKSIQSAPEIVVICEDDEQIKLPQSEIKNASRHEVPAPYLTLEQLHVVSVIEEETNNNKYLPVVLNSDRGRGKSAALGIAISKLVQHGHNNIVITAPRLSATDIIFKHIELLLPDAEISRGTVKYKNSVIQFYSPDLLISEDIKSDILFVDEAAAIPVPVLTSFLNKYPQCIFATTVHGYEGTGRGFALRFNKILNEQKPGWKKCLMKTPVRWAEDDPLERWMFNLLCLDAEIVSADLIGNFELSKININLITQEQLINDKKLLDEVFSLLVLAHYRTQPSDLQRLLDDKNISLYVVKYHNYVLAVTLVNHEGQFSSDLSSDVYRGNRRPAGHLLAQALTYHCGVEYAATLHYARIMRIAVHPEFQQQGIGSALLNFVIREEKKSGCDAIGASFGMNKPLLRFWSKAGFKLLRIGFKREQTSGEHAAIMVMALSQQGEAVTQEAYSRFGGQSVYWFDDVLKDIPPEIQNDIQCESEQVKTLRELDRDDLDSFVKFSRNYELCIGAINRFVMTQQKNMAQDDFPGYLRQVINYKVIKKMSWKNISSKMALSGQDEARNLFQQAIMHLYNESIE